MQSIIQESMVDSKVLDYKVTGDKVYFDSLLQVFDIKNKNNRRYPSKVMISAWQEQIQPKALSRNFVGELDHPISSDINRKTTILYKEISHLFSETWLEGNKLYGHGETLRTRYGRDMAGLIQDKIPIGFSLRAWGDVNQIGDSLVVQDPINILCYDCVQNPSYEMARITKITQENFNEMANDTFELSYKNNEQMVLVEGTNIELLQNKLQMFNKNAILENEELSIMYKKFLKSKINNIVNNYNF
jgi:hypothetical protein